MHIFFRHLDLLPTLAPPFHSASSLWLVILGVVAVCSIGEPGIANAEVADTATVQLILCEPTLLRLEGRCLVGATGGWLQLPPNWDPSEGQLSRGVAGFAFAPETFAAQQRQRLVRRWRESYAIRLQAAARETWIQQGGLAEAFEPTLHANQNRWPDIQDGELQLPTDVIAWQSAQGIQLACDWNANWLIEDDEVIERVEIPVAKFLSVPVQVQCELNDRGLLVRFLDIQKLLRSAQRAAPDSPIDRPAISTLPLDQPAWWNAYQNDSVENEYLRRRAFGESAEAILNQVKKNLGPGPLNLSETRQLMLAYDQFDTRKQNLETIIQLANRVLRIVTDKLGKLPGPIDPATPHSDQQHANSSSKKPSLKPHQIQDYAWAVDAAYRKTRAIGYRELPQVMAKHPIVDPQRQHQEFEASFLQLAGLVNREIPDLMNRSEFILTRIRRQRRSGNRKVALELLEVYASESSNPRWYFKKKADMYSELSIGLPERRARAEWFLKENQLPPLDRPLDR